MTQTKSSITDIPRNVAHESGKKDQFGIKPFEDGLTQFIKETNTPITIALQGEWGSGKTSLMNSLNQGLSTKEHGDFHAVWLNTWEYALMKDASETLMDIITGLIKETSEIADIDKSVTQKMVRKVWSIGKTAARFAAVTAANKALDNGGDFVDSILSESGKSSIGEIRDDLERIISECIVKTNRKGFIFYIDDLDRIDPPVAVQLLELLKNIFTLKNCVFILAIDYDVVIKGLEPKFGKISAQNEREFRSFFDKIIQVPFSMPVSSYHVDEFLMESLVATNYISKAQLEKKEVGTEKGKTLIAKFSEISNLSVGTNPRALKRLLNSLSLIRCINGTRGAKDEDNQLNDDLELLVNFTLVSIQIAYPPVYKLLTQYSGFDKWNESVAIQMNLEALDTQSIEKLKQSEEFDDEWEQILFRLCENDHYLKKRALSISRLLNSLKIYINDQGEDVDDVIGAVISLSSVTSLEANDKPIADYHRGHFLKTLRTNLINDLKSQNPKVSEHISTQGKRVQSNAYIKFSEKPWGHWMRLHSSPHEGKIRLLIGTTKWVSPITYPTLDECIDKAGMTEKLAAIEKKWDEMIAQADGFSASGFRERIEHQKSHHAIVLTAYISLPTPEDFRTQENIKRISAFTANTYRFLIELTDLCNEMKGFYKK
jgi:GTPase SAR1 family protein